MPYDRRRTVSSPRAPKPANSMPKSKVAQRHMPGRHTSARGRARRPCRHASLSRSRAAESIAHLRCVCGSHRRCRHSHPRRLRLFGRSLAGRRHRTRLLTITVGRSTRVLDVELGGPTSTTTIEIAGYGERANRATSAKQRPCQAWRRHRPRCHQSSSRFRLGNAHRVLGWESKIVTGRQSQ
jgi:hypothetical protein